MPHLQIFDSTQARPYFDTLVDIHQAAFAQPPYLETLPDVFNFTARLSYHARQAGFRCALIRPEASGAPVGFVYGYTGLQEGWFYHLAAQCLSPALLHEYLADYFEFAELAVLPAWQGQGLGGRLHDAILAGLNHRTACLATPDLETSALRLYQNRAWLALAHAVTLPGTLLQYQLMAKRL